MRLFVTGDTHGNTPFVCHYLFPTASALHADAIVQLGDFGFWEHVPRETRFLDAVAESAEATGIPLYWLHGNHDNWPEVIARYGHNLSADGFVMCRPRVFYIPQGHAWSWAGFALRAFGGAYSIDKDHRLRQEALLLRQRRELAAACRAQGIETPEPADTAGTLWFPREEPSDAEMHALLRQDAGVKDIVFSHDRPRAAGVGQLDWLDDEPACVPNQERLQRALEVHRPRLWLHGHLHHRYTDQIRCGGGEGYTDVVGLSCDNRAAGRFWRPEQSWVLLELLPGREFEVIDGFSAAREVPEELYERDSGEETWDPWSPQDPPDGRDVT